MGSISGSANLPDRTPTPGPASGVGSISGSANLDGVLFVDVSSRVWVPFRVQLTCCQRF